MNEIKSCDNKIDHQYFLTTLLSDKKIQKTLTDILYNKFYENNITIIKDYEEHFLTMSGYDISRISNYIRR